MRNSQPYIRPRRLESIRMVVAENGESQSYGVEDGGLFVEMVVTSDCPKENQTIVRFRIILRKMDIYI